MYLQVAVFSVLQCPVHEQDTAFNAGFRVDLVRAHPSFRKAAWHDDVSARAAVGGEEIYGRVCSVRNAFRTRVLAFSHNRELALCRL